MSDKATPRPWMVAPCSSDDEVRDIVSEYSAKDGRETANWIAQCDMQDETDHETAIEVNHANARLIVEAVNAYDSLRAEVEEVKRQLGLANQALDGMRERDSRHRAEAERLKREAQSNRRAAEQHYAESERLREELEQAERERDNACKRSQFHKDNHLAAEDALKQAEARAERLREALKMLEFDGDGDEAHVVGWPTQETARAALSEEER